MEPWKYEPARDRDLSPIERARSVRREAGLLETAGHIAWLAFVKAYMRVFHRLRVRGRRNIPREPPFVLVSNHSSHLDALVLASALPFRLCNRVFPVAAGDVFFETKASSLFSAVMINALPVWRKSCGPGALRELRERLVGEPCGYIIFPEGGRSRDGALQTFRAGLGIVVAGAKVPVVPCHLRGTHEAMPPGARWPRPRKLRLAVGEPLQIDDLSNDREGWRRIARGAEEAVRRLGRLPAPPSARPERLGGPLIAPKESAGPEETLDVPQARSEALPRREGGVWA